MDSMRSLALTIKATVCYTHLGLQERQSANISQVIFFVDGLELRFLIALGLKEGLALW
jgi:hypothetical protein